MDKNLNLYFWLWFVKFVYMLIMYSILFSIYPSHRMKKHYFLTIIGKGMALVWILMKSYFALIISYLDTKLVIVSATN